MNRTTQTVIHFSSPVMLPGFDRPQPAGDYRVDQDEAMIEGLSMIGWRRTGSFIHLPAIGHSGSAEQMVPVSPTDLDAAIQKDKQS